MQGVNKAQLLGNLGADPELRRTEKGEAVATLSVCTNRSWKDKATGEEKDEATWHRVVVWGVVAENCAEFLRKGRLVYVEGRIRNYSYEKDGQTKYATEIVAWSVIFLPSGDSKKPPHPAEEKGSDLEAPPPGPWPGDDNIPF